MKRFIKKFVIFLSTIFFITHTWFTHAWVWDIGHWRDSVWGQIPGTTFWGFNFNSEIRNDGIYTKPNDSTIEVTEAGDYLIIATTHDEDTSNGRYNSQITISQVAGSWNIFSSRYTWYSRDNSENESWTRAVGIVIWVTANSQFQVQKRRDADGPTGWSVINSSDLQVVKLDQSNYWIYNIWWTGNSYGWTTPNTVDITSILSESNTNAIEWNTSTDTITLKWDNKTYLVAWSVSFDSANSRTQRIWHLEYDNIDSLWTRSYCYARGNTNKFCWLGSMDIIRTSTTDINLQTEIYRWDWVLASQGWADIDWTITTDWSWQLIILEMPDILEAFSSEDSTGLQDVTTPQTLNIARDVNFNDTESFTKASNTTVNVVNAADIFSWANIWTARSNVSVNRRQTSYGSIVIDWIEQTTWRHGNYSRWNQWNQDTFALWFHPAGIFTTSSDGETLWVNTDPLPGWESGWNDTTQPWTIGFFALNLDTLALDPSPGWVETNLQIWLKADAWTSTITHWSPLSTWSDQSWNWFDATAWVAPTYLYDNNSNHLNYNPIIDFDWSTQYLENLNNWAYSHNYFTVIVPDNQVDGMLSWQVPFAFDCNSWVLNTWTCNLTFAWWVLWAFTAAINDEVITLAIWSSTNWRSSQIWSFSYDSNIPMLLEFNENSSSNWTDIYEKWIKVDNYNVNTYQNISTADYRIWMSTDWTYPFPYDGKIAEIINYNSRLDDTSRQKIESYLAVKYGITLNSWTQNYINSDWTTTIWDTTTAWAYTNDIFAIARDDISLLSQVKSKSTNNEWVITIEAVSEWTNLLPSFVDINDLESLSISNNNWWNVWTQIWAPSWYYILSRQWLAQEEWEVWLANLSFDVDNTNFDIPPLSSGLSYYFVYDSNNNSSLSDEIPILMTNLLWSIWQAVWINLNNWTLFNISTQASTNNIPTDISIDNDNVNENVPIWNVVWNFSTTDADLSDTHTYSLVAWTWDDDNSLFSITGSTLSIETSPDYEIKNSYSIRIQTDDWNWWQYQESFTIYINNIWEAIDSIIDFEELDDENKYNVTSWTWTRTTSNPNEWLYSIESSNSWDNTQSCFEVINTLSATWTLNFDYNVSSQAWSDFLRFYIDNIEQQAWSWTVPWTNYIDNNISAWTHSYKWCFIKDWWWSAWTDNAFIDYITFNSSVSDITPPNIISINYLSWTLFPWWNHNIIINYSDSGSWIDISSDLITLNKWDWISSWWADISTTGFNLWSKIITTTSATYPTNNLSFGKYRYDFQISDNDSNTSSTWAVFYIDEPELIISTWSLNIWKIWTSTWFSVNQFDISVKTVWAYFDLILKNNSLLSYSWATITDWNWSEWYGYDKSPFSSTISSVWTWAILTTQPASINTNWDKNTYNYSIRFWSKIWAEQAAWLYNWSINFLLDLDY